MLLRRTTPREAELVAGGLRAVVADEFAADLDGGDQAAAADSSIARA